MEGLSERQYALRVGLSRGAVQKAKAAGRLVLHADGSVDAAASDQRRAEFTDPSKTRVGADPGAEGVDDAGADSTRPTPRTPAPKLKPVPEAALAAVGETLRDQGLAVPAVGGATTFLQAKTANEVLKAQERKLRLQKTRGELIDRARATALVFRLSREARDAWVTWPARVAALMAAELGTDPAALHAVLESHVRAHLDELAEIRPEFR